MELTNILIGQSGGPTAVINSTLAGAVAAAKESGKIGHVYGMLNGIKGYLEGRKTDLLDLTEEELGLLKTTPAAYLGSCRFKLPKELTDPLYAEIFRRLEEDNIGYVLYIGGNDSMDTADKLSQYAASVGSDIRIIGVPKTIDNDLTGTDHTPGYGSAAKFVAAQVRQIVLDAEVYRQDAVTIVEIMGRNAGWLTAAASLARKYEGDNPILIYLPEVDFDPEEMLRRIREALKERHAVVVCVSEGIHDKDGILICELTQGVTKDVFGNKQLSGCGKVIEQMVRVRLGVKVRSVELNVTQRCNAVEASLTDIEEAFECGRQGVFAALEGKSGCMISMEREEGEEYRIVYTAKPVGEISNEVRGVPTEWITEDLADVKAAFAAYALPLIQGESRPPMKDGLPVFLYRKDPNHKA